MYRFCTLVIISLLPMLAMAQSYSQAPMLVVGGPPPAPVAANANAPSSADAGARTDFPESAITKVGDVTNPSKQAAASTKPVTPPAASKAEESKLWPSNTLQIFMPRCTALKLPLIEPCRCVITKLMNAMPHDEFLQKSQNNTIEQDPRLIRIRTECATAPQRKK